MINSCPIFSIYLNKSLFPINNFQSIGPPSRLVSPTYTEKQMVDTMVWNDKIVSSLPNLQDLIVSSKSALQAKWEIDFFCDETQDKIIIIFYF